MIDEELVFCWRTIDKQEVAINRQTEKVAKIENFKSLFRILRTSTACLNYKL